MTTKALVLTALFGASSCGPPPDFVTPNGHAEFYLNGVGTVTPEIADVMEGQAVALMTEQYGSERLGDFWAAISGAQVSFYKGFVGCGSIEGAVGCYHALSESIYLTAYTCPWDSPYVHELVHRLQDKVMYLNDGQHLGPIWKGVNRAQGENRKKCYGTYI